MDHGTSAPTTSRATCLLTGATGLDLRPLSEECLCLSCELVLRQQKGESLALCIRHARSVFGVFPELHGIFLVELLCIHELLCQLNQGLVILFSLDFDISVILYSFLLL